MSQETISAAEYLRRQGLPPAGSGRSAAEEKAGGARSAVHPQDKMNKLEAAYAQRLHLLQRAGEVRRWRYEAITLRLADNTRYRPDFLVEFWERGAEIHEVKGFWRDDARVKFRVAAEQYPMFRFVIVMRKNGAWDLSEMPSGWVAAPSFQTDRRG